MRAEAAQLATERAIAAPDRVVTLVSFGLDEEGLRSGIHELDVGVTEICTHPALDTAELRASDPDWPERIKEQSILEKDGMLSSILNEEAVEVIGYRKLRDLMREANR